MENVTHEIPDRGAIGEPWRQETDYFADIATAVLERPAWGLIAARLGRRDHRTEFVRRAWFGIDDKPGLLQQLRDCENEDVDWQAAVARFSRCHERVLRLQQERSLAYRVVELKYAVEESDRLTDKARRDLSRVRKLVESAARAVESCEVRQREHQRLRLTVEAGEWRATAHRLADELSGAARKLHRAHQQVIAVRRHLAATYREDVEIRRELEKARTRLGQRPDLLALYQAALGQDELAAPWTDREWNTARTELFFEALRLHQAFLKAESARGLQRRAGSRHYPDPARPARLRTGHSWQRPARPGVTRLGYGTSPPVSPLRSGSGGTQPVRLCQGHQQAIQVHLQELRPVLAMEARLLTPSEQRPPLPRERSGRRPVHPERR